MSEIGSSRENSCFVAWTPWHYILMSFLLSLNPRLYLYISKNVLAPSAWAKSISSPTLLPLTAYKTFIPELADSPSSLWEGLFPAHNATLTWNTVTHTACQTGISMLTFIKRPGPASTALLIDYPAAVVHFSKLLPALRWSRTVKAMTKERDRQTWSLLNNC